jgi:uncharacterized protein YkwD
VEKGAIAMRRYARVGLVATLCLGLIQLATVTQSMAQTMSVSQSHRIFIPGVSISTSTSTGSSFWSATELQAVEQINQERRRVGCSPVQLNRELGTAAKQHSQNMSQHRFFSHTGFDGSTFVERAKAAGYPYAPTGEVIAAGYSTSSAAVKGWMDSKSHRDIILTCANTDMGLGLYADPASEWHYYWTAVFGRR